MCVCVYLFASCSRGIEWYRVYFLFVEIEREREKVLNDDDDDDDDDDSLSNAGW